MADEIAPDGCEVRRLGRTGRASMAQFRLPAGAVGRAVVHRQVEEIWYILSGEGEMWQRQQRADEIIALAEGVSVVILAGCEFQVRASAGAALIMIAATMPPWPGEGEATEVSGPWAPNSTQETV